MRYLIIFLFLAILSGCAQNKTNRSDFIYRANSGFGDKAVARYPELADCFGLGYQDAANEIQEIQSNIVMVERDNWPWALTDDEMNHIAYIVNGQTEDIFVSRHAGTFQDNYRCVSSFKHYSKMLVGR